jgi:hypothetical protein
MSKRIATTNKDNNIEDLDDNFRANEGTESFTDNEQLDARIPAVESYQLRDDEYFDFDSLPITRPSSRSNHIFDCPAELIDPRLSYQFIRTAARGCNEGIFNESPAMKKVGWVECTSGPVYNYFKEYVTEDANYVQIDDLRLMVRRKALTEQCLAECEARARQEYRDATSDSIQVVDEGGLKDADIRVKREVTWYDPNRTQIMR